MYSALSWFLLFLLPAGGPGISMLTYPAFVISPLYFFWRMMSLSSFIVHLRVLQRKDCVSEERMREGPQRTSDGFNVGLRSLRDWSHRGFGADGKVDE